MTQPQCLFTRTQSTVDDMGKGVCVCVGARGGGGYLKHLRVALLYMLLLYPDLYPVESGIVDFLLTNGVGLIILAPLLSWTSGEVAFRFWAWSSGSVGIRKPEGIGLAAFTKIACWSLGSGSRRT